ncbi:nitric oxide reductase activation protein NorD [Hydrogenophaga sp. PAMC20947]|uniref:nitric oxide reductase activation protein NorD n=1 Tax=Hydrogenophaga sp. PAMC20947 TaxID=2565558 RepID=UPI00109E31B8|nr:nitric oxide reductase activation protein NorD [Hydrogenophaga sp. PAMC20947]QCB46446.1 nitric oxide reductase activation protein NorD [Hydrogenophaga sp. PAMC20947]
MSVHLQDYAEWTDTLEPASCALLAHAWADATKVFSERGLDNYVKGASALGGLGRGAGLVNAWIEAAPPVAREVGEDVVGDLATTALSLASRTSGSVIELVLGTAPTAARRLADGELFLQYLQFLNTLVAQAPRGLRPMLDKLDVLFGQLTLGGLRRWATWGAHAHRTQFEEQIAYFGLNSKESLAMLQQERKGTLLVDVQRRINMYLRALWGRDFFMRPTAGDFENREGHKPFIEDWLIHLPDAFDAVEGNNGTVNATELYRAAAAHAAAHVVYTREPISAESLNPWQMAVIGLIEDARVEALAVARFPGLRALWASLHTIDRHEANTAGDYLNRLARALVDPKHRDEHPWIAQGRALVADGLPRILAQPFESTVSWDIGVALAHSYRDLCQGPAFQLRTDLQAAPYRDDNRYFWAFEGFDADEAAAAGYQPEQQVRKHVNVMELANEIEVENAGDDAQEIWVMGTEFFPYEDRGVSFNQSEGHEPMVPPSHYPEWDHLIQLERPAWVTVQERRAKVGDLAVVDAITTEHRRLIGRMKVMLDAMQPQGVQRQRKLEDGDEIDINAALDSLVQMRVGQQPDPRIMMRSVRQVRDISVLVLLDLSHSTNDVVRAGEPGDKGAGQERTVLDLTREACVLLADAVNKVGDPFGIHGFCSDGRHDVNYWRFKDFDQPYDDLAKARIAGMTGQLSTRMGAAIRHATVTLRQQRSSKKLLLVITDGEPADVDVRDPQYLRHDTKKAVEEAGRSGVFTYCMSLDPRADQYVSRIFGARNYVVVDKVERLPEKLPLLYAGLTR